MSNLHSLSEPKDAPVLAATQTRLFATLFVVATIFNAAQSVSFTPLSIVGASLYGGEELATLPTTAVLFGRALIAYPIGWLMDRLGRRLGIGFGYLLSILGTILSVVAIGRGSFVYFCVGSLLNGMGRGTGEQSRYAAADVAPPERSATAVGWIVFAGTIGGVVGTLLIPLTQQFAPSWGIDAMAGPYAFTTLLSVVAFAIIMLLLFPDPKQISLKLAAHRQSTTAVATKTRTQKEIFADPTVRMAVLTLGICQLVMTLIMVINPLHMHHMHYSIEEVSWVSTAHILGMFLFAGAVGSLVNRYGRMPMMITGSVILLLSAILSPLARGVPMLAFTLFLLGLGWSFGYVAASSLLGSVLAPGERARTQGISETLVAVGAMLGSLGTGPTFGWGGIIAVGLIGIALSLFLIAMLLFLPTRQPALASGD